MIDFFIKSRKPGHVKNLVENGSPILSFPPSAVENQSLIIDNLLTITMSSLLRLRSGICQIPCSTQMPRSGCSPPGWKPGKAFVFVSLSDQVDHLGSPCLCFLDYQAQISIPVIRVFSKHCLHVFTVFLLKLNALQSSDANPFDQPGCAEKLPDIDIVPQLTINKHNRK